MYPSVLSMGNNHFDISSVLEHAENVCRKSHSFRSEWPKELCRVHEKIVQNVTNEIQKAMHTLLQWETNFKKEIPEIPLTAVKERLNVMCSLENMLLKRIAKMRQLMTSSTDKDVLFREANELMKIIASIEERMRYSVLPVVIFHEVTPFSEENPHKFWTLATFDIQPHQLILQSSHDIKLGTAVFCIHVPLTKCLAQLPKLLKCTLKLEDSNVLQELKPHCNNDHINIEVNIIKQCYHTINVQLYEHHICGSPFKFLPLQKIDPVSIEHYRTEGHCYRSVKAQENSVTFDKDTSDDDDDDDPMMDSQEYQCRRQRLSRTGIARVNSFLGEAALDRANETTALEDLKGQDDVKSVKMCTEINSALDTDKKYQETDMNANKDTEEKSSVYGNAIIDINNISSKNVYMICKEHPQLDIKRWRSPLSEEVFDDLKSDVAITGEVAENGNVADDVEHGAYQSNFSQNIGLSRQTVEIEQTTAIPSMVIKEGELLRRMALDDSLNLAGDESESSAVFIPKVASRKKLGLIQPLRRPRVPSNFSEDSKKCENVDIAEKTPLIKLEVRNATRQEKGNEIPDPRVSVDDLKTIPKVPQKTAQTTELDKNQLETCKPLKSTNDTTEKDIDMNAAGLDESESFANSAAKKIAFDESSSYKENSPSQGIEGKKGTSLVTKAGKQLNKITVKLSGKISKKLYGPSDDPLLQPIGVAELNDKRVVVADTFNNRMGLFSSEGVFLKYLNTVNLRCPSAVVVLQDGNFAVKEMNGIVIFRENGDFLKTLPVSLKRPYGLTVLEDGNLMTVETTGKGFMTLITVNPDSGSEISRVKVDLGLSTKYHRISKPRFISYHRHGRILVVDLGLNCIFVIDITTGSVLSVFGEEGSNEGQFRDPSGIACDSDGYIVVGDSRNHRIQVFDPYGHFLCTVSTDVPLSRPSGICLTSGGGLLISNYWDHSVAKYLLTN